MNMAPSVLWMVLAVLLYAVLMVGTEAKFGGYSPQSLQLYFYPVMLVIAAGWLWGRKSIGLENNPPPLTLLTFGVLLGLVYYCADFFFLKALTSAGSNATTVSIIAALSPVFVASMKYFLAGTVPNRYHIAAFLLAIVVVVLATKGEMISATK